MVALLFALLLVCSTAYAQQPVDLAANPSFEIADGDLPAFWQQRTPTDGDRQMFWPEGVARTGERCVAMTNHSDVLSRWRSGHDRDLGLVPGTQATLSAWVKTEGSGRPNVQIYLMGADDSIIAQPTSPVAEDTAGWTQLSVSVTVPGEPLYVLIYCNLRGSGTAWFDDVQFMGVPGPPLPGAWEPISYTVAAFEELNGYEQVDRSRRRVLQPLEGVETADGTALFWERSARYDLTLLYLDEPDGASTFRVYVNGQERGSVVADGNDDVVTGADQVGEFTIKEVDLQRLSRIRVVGEVDQGELARVFGLRFARTGRFEGELLTAEELPMPDSLRIHQTPAQQRSAAGMLSRYVQPFITAGNQAVTAERDALQTPEDVRAWQVDTRSRLGELFGRWPEPTALNPKMVGRIELDYCTIEKIIIETEPGYFVPMNFYIPKGHSLPAPAVCITMGHAAEGKGYHLYHEFALGLAQKGYVACAFDPMGQGERITYSEPPEELGRKGGPVGQHHYALRPSYLVGRSLSGLRTWDGVRVVDYMLTRPEVDPERIAVGGNSGGGQMTLLITACHPKTVGCAAAHPGGSCENTYYLAKRDIDLRLIGLIPPRACRWIVGEDSGEERGHRSRRDWLQPLYDIFGAPDANHFQLVAGVHNMEQPKREAAYEWYNRWLGMDAGMAEGPIEALPVEDLWCTEHGSVELDLGSLREDQMNAKLMREMAPARPEPAADAVARERFLTERRAAVLVKIALHAPADRETPRSREVGQYPHDTLTIEKLTIASEAGIELPALLIRPEAGATGSPIIWASEFGKPTQVKDESVPLALARSGHTVLAVDVRGAGELDIERGARGRTVEYDASQWRRDGHAIAFTGAGKTLLGARAFDLTRCMDWLDSREDLATDGYVLAGEGLGGTWVLAAGLADERVGAVATVGMLGSYRMILDNKWHNVRGYFWVPKALETYDLPDLPALLAPRPMALINTVDQMAHPLPDAAVRDEFAWSAKYYAAAGADDALTVTTDADVDVVAEAIAAAARGAGL